MVFSYLCVEGGLGAHAPKIGIFHRMGYTFILRRFYRGKLTKKGCYLDLFSFF